MPRMHADRGGQANQRGLPTGSVTFLITDIEGSTRLLIALGEDYTAVLQRHHEILRDAVARAGGTAVSTAGDSLFAVFPSASGAASAAAAAQRDLAAQDWPQGRDVKVRMGLHSGEGRLGGDDYVGLDVHRAARISSAANGGQVLLSASTAHLLTTDPETWELDDLGLHRLKDLVHPEHLFQLRAPGLQSRFPPLRSGRAGKVVVPPPRTSFVARPDVEELIQLLESQRLVTLTGPGGTGKTRLAVETALRSKDRFPDGVYFVDLAPVTHPDLVATAVAGTVGVEVGNAPAAQRVAAELADKSVLLVLDNFEQVLHAAPLVDDLLGSSPGLRVLATSRGPLRLSAEQEYPVPPLPVPPEADTDVESLAANPAVELFVQRAARVRPNFRLTPDNAGAIAQIVRRLDGLPLAVELAAARTRLLTPAAIAERVREAGSGDLVARDRDVPARQRSLRAVISWSHDLLDGPQRRAFRRFSVFRDGAGIKEIEAVLGADARDPVGLIESLVDHSLLREYEDDGQIRLRMLVTIREFAEQQLTDSGEADEIRRRHTDAYLALAERARPNLTGWSQREWTDRLMREHDNLLAALDWAIASGDADRSQRLSWSLWRFWQIRGLLDEGSHYAEAGLALVGSDPIVHARALEAAGGIAYWRGDLDRARDCYTKALAIHEPLGDLAATANARFNYGMVLGWQHDTSALAEATSQLQLARREAASAGARATEAWATWGIGNVLDNAERFTESAEHFEEALREFRDLDEPFGIGWSLFMHATVLSRSPAAGQVADTAVERSGTEGATDSDGGTLTGDGAQAETLDLARHRLHEGVRLFASFRDIPAIMLHCAALARIAAHTGEGERALRLLGAGRALRRLTGAGLLEANEELEEALGEGSTQELVRERFAGNPAELVAEAEQYSLEEAIAYLLEELPDPPDDESPLRRVERPTAGSPAAD